MRKKEREKERNKYELNGRGNRNKNHRIRAWINQIDEESMKKKNTIQERNINNENE